MSQSPSSIQPGGSDTAFKPEFDKLGYKEIGRCCSQILLFEKILNYSGETDLNSK